MPPDRAYSYRFYYNTIFTKGIFMGDTFHHLYIENQAILHSIGVLIAVFASTFLTRFMPFIVFRKRAIPKSLITLGEVLPPAMIGMLFVYCFASVDIAHTPFGLNELCGFILTASIYLLTKVGVLAVIGGTIGYAAIVQTHILHTLLAAI